MSSISYELTLSDNSDGSTNSLKKTPIYPVIINPFIEKILQQEFSIRFPSNCQTNRTCSNYGLYEWNLHLYSNSGAIDYILQQPDVQMHFYEKQQNNLNNPQKKRELAGLSQNHHPEAIRLLEKNPKLIDWHNLATNPFAENLITNNCHHVSFFHLCNNESEWAIDLIKTELNVNFPKTPTSQRCPRFLSGAFILSEKYINWWYLSKNPNACDLIKLFPEHVNNDTIWANPVAYDELKNTRELNQNGWYYLSGNSNPNAFDRLIANPDKIDWRYLSKNPYSKAIELLDANPSKICWFYLSYNKNPKCIELYEKYYEKYKNNYSSVTNYLYSNITNLLTQPYIFVYNYLQMKQNMDIIRKELIEKAIHPSRVLRWIESENENMLE